MNTQPISLPDRQSGLAMVEFVISVPVLLLLMLGTAELGRAFYEYNTLTKTVRDGARYLSEKALNPAGLMEIDDAARTQTQNLVVYGNAGGTGDPLMEGLAVEDVTVEAAPDADVPAEHIRVTATYQYSPIFELGIPTFGSGGTIDTNLTFRASITMRAL